VCMFISDKFCQCPELLFYVCACVCVCDFNISVQLKQCNDSFRLVGNLKVHQYVHSVEHPCHCDVCNNSSRLV